MKTLIYKDLAASTNKKFAVLVDPDKYDFNQTDFFIKTCLNAKVDYLFIGGSHLFKDNFNRCIADLKKQSSIPIIIFPGEPSQVDERADAILLLSLISGRNSELLIGKHVMAAPHLKRTGIEIISTGYILIENGRTTSVAYMSNTLPIPADKEDIAASTAMAGEMLGLKLIYLEAGSGAANPVPERMIRKVKENISIPLIVGGGINSVETAKNICRAGADLIVVGNSIEKNNSLIPEIAAAVHSVI